MEAERPRTWEKIYDLPQVLFLVRVSCVDVQDKTKYWVIEENNMMKLLDLVEEMNSKHFNKLVPLEEGQLVLNELVAVSINDLLYRAVIKKILKEEKMCQVFLIDYGSKKKVLFSHLYAATPKMENTNAFAFSIKSHIFTLSLEKNSLISIKIIQKKSENQFLVQFCSEIDQPRFPLLPYSGSFQVELVTILNDGRGALLKITDKNFRWNLNIDLNETRGLNGPVENGITVVVRSKTGDLKRAIVVQTMSVGLYLVYLVDDGLILVTKSIRVLKNDYGKYPTKVIFLRSINEEKFFSKLKNHDKIFIKAYPSNENVGLYKMPCLLQINNDNPVTMIATPLLAWEHKYWNEPLDEDCLVNITHYISLSEIYISSANSKFYYEVLKSLASTFIPFEQDDIISVGDNVMIVWFSKKICCRAEVQSICLENDTFDLFNIDTGCTYKLIRRRFLRKMDRFIMMFPISLKKVKLSVLKDIKPNSDAKEERISERLKRYISNKNQFNLHYINKEGDIVELINKQTSSVINEVLFSLLYKPIERNFKFHNLERFECTPGNNLAFLVLNANSISEGYLTGAHFNKKSDLLRIQQFENMISSYCKIAARTDECDIMRNQMCLAYDSETSRWYRALELKCVDANNHLTVINFDVGTVRKVSITDIMPIPKELLFALYSHTYFIKDFLKLTLEQREGLIHILKPYNVICANIELSLQNDKPFSKENFILDINLFEDE